MPGLVVESLTLPRVALPPTSITSTFLSLLVVPVVFTYVDLIC